MTVTINGSTGIDKVQDGTIVQADLATGVAGTGPAFSVWSNTASSVTSAANVPIIYNNVVFDTASAWNTTTSRFTPQVAGYYQIEANIAYSTANYAVATVVAKNGSAYKYIGNTGTASSSAGGSTLVYLNGSTDHIQIFGYSATTQNSAVGSTITHCSGFLVRAA